MCLLFALVTGNCDILERAPVLLIAFQGQFLRPGKHTTTQGNVKSNEGLGKGT